MDRRKEIDMVLTYKLINESDSDSDLINIRAETGGAEAPKSHGQEEGD